MNVRELASRAAGGAARGHCPPSPCHVEGGVGACNISHEPPRPSAGPSGGENQVGRGDVLVNFVPSFPWGEEPSRPPSFALRCVLNYPEAATRTRSKTRGQPGPPTEKGELQDALVRATGEGMTRV